MREYEVNINGLVHTLMLDDEAAKQYGDRAKPVQSKEAPTPSNKAAAAPANKAAKKA